MAKDFEFGSKEAVSNALAPKPLERRSEGVRTLLTRKNSAVVANGIGLSTTLLTLAACGSSSDPVVPPVVVATVAQLNPGNMLSPIVIQGTSVGAVINVADIAGDNHYDGIEITATGDAASGDKLSFKFLDGNAEDTVVLTGTSTITDFSIIEVVNGTVDFTAIDSSAFDGVTMILGSTAVLTADQFAALLDVELRSGATSADIRVEFAVGDDFDAVIAKLAACEGVTVTFVAEDGSLTPDQIQELEDGGADVVDGSGDVPVPTLTLTELVEIYLDDGSSPDYSYMLDDANYNAGERTIAELEDHVAAVGTIVEHAANANELTSSVTYTLLDTLENLTDADADVLSGATSYTLSDESLTAADLTDVSVADLSGDQADAVADVRAIDIVDGATNGDTITVNNGDYTLLDTLENLTDADADVLSGATSYTLSDESLTAADLSDVSVADLSGDQADAVADVRNDAVVDGATNGDTITVNNGTYTLLDSGANLADADPSILADATGVTASGNTTLAQADAIAAATEVAITATVVQDPDSFDGFLADLLNLEAGNAWSFEVEGEWAASDLLALAAITTATVDATGVTYILGSYEDLLALSTSETLDLDTRYDIRLYDERTDEWAPVTIDQIAELDALNGAGSLDYHLMDTAENLAANDGHYVNSANEIEITDPATIAQLTAIDAVYNMNDVTFGSISDSIANLLADVDAEVSYIGGYNPKVTVTDDEIDAEDANTICDNTMDVVTATVSSGTASSLLAALGDADSNDMLTLTVTGSASASDLFDLDDKTDVTIDASGVTEITGDAEDIPDLIENYDITLGDDFDVVVTGTPSLSELDAIAAETSGAVSYTNVGGEIADLLLSDWVTADLGDVYVYDDATVDQIFDLDLMTEADLHYDLADTVNNLLNASTLIDNIDVTVTDAASIQDLSDIDDLNGDGDVTAEIIEDNLDNLIFEGDVNGYVFGDVAVTITNIQSDAQQTNQICDATDGVVTATVDPNDAATLISDLNNADNNDMLSLTVSDGYTLAADLIELDALTGATIDASEVETITGTGEDIAQIIEEGDITLAVDFIADVTGDFAFLSDLDTIADATSEDVVYDAVQGDIEELLASDWVNGTVDVQVNDVATVDQIRALDLMTSGTLSYDLSDTVAHLLNADGQYLGDADYATVTDAATIAQLTTIYNAIALDVNVDAISDTAAHLIADVNGEYNFISQNDADVTVTDDDISADDANTICDATGGVVTATVTSDTAANLNNDLVDTDSDDMLTLTVTGAADADDLLDLIDKTGVMIDATGVTVITGTAEELYALSQADIDSPANFNINVTGASLDDITQMNAMNGTGWVHFTDILDSAANIAANVDDIDLNGIDITFTDAATLAQVAAADDANGNADLNYAEDGIADTYDNLLENDNGYVDDDVNVTVMEESITVTQALAIAALTDGVVTANITETDAASLFRLNADEDEYDNQFTASVDFLDLTNFPAWGRLDSNISDLTVNGSAFSDDMDLRDIDANLTVYGGARSDEILTGGGNDTVAGGEGDDYIEAGDGNDSVMGDAGDEEMYGDDGDDILAGGEGDDYINGGDDEDSLIGGAGNDELNGDWGDDTVAGGDGDDELYGYYGNDSINGDAGNDLLDGYEGDDTLAGGEGDDYINGGDDEDSLIGGDGDDELNGDWGDDTVAGGDGDDTLYGGYDDDRLSGGSGADYLDGDGGDDTYVFTSVEDSNADAMDTIGEWAGTLDLTSIGEEGPSELETDDTDYGSFEDMMAAAADNGVFNEASSNILVTHAEGDTYVLMDANADGAFDANSGDDTIIKFDNFVEVTTTEDDKILHFTGI